MVTRARRCGRTAAAGPYRELRYEDLVAAPEQPLREISSFLGLEFEPAMLEYHRSVDRSRLADHPRLAQPPAGDVRRWREEMEPRESELFEAIAGDLLAELGYARAFPAPPGRARARAAAERAAFRARLSSWRGAVALARRSPAWRVRQVYIRRTARVEAR